MFPRFVPIAIITLAFSTAWADSQQTHLPNTHVGDRWQYRVIDGFTNETTLEFSQRVVDLNDREIVVQFQGNNAPGKRLLYFTRDWNQVDNGSTKFDPFRPEFKFPMDVGMSWKQEYRSRNSRGQASTSYAYIKVSAFEKVTTPAGVFDAYRIETDVESRGADANAIISKARIITWYAPAAQKHVRREAVMSADGRTREKTIDELVEYSLEDKTGQVR